MAKPQQINQVVEKAVENNDEGFITLPFNSDGFREFIKSLLGSPQAISKSIHGAFEISKADLNNLNHLLLQRIFQQNGGVLVQFTAKIVFCDNSTVELNSIEELLTYNEIKPVISHMIHLSWDFLVQFQDKEVPEKQNIQVSMLTSGLYDREFFDDTSINNRIYRYAEGGVINFRIEHTARTWGADIEALLSHYFMGILKEEPIIKKFIRKHKSAISILTSIIVFFTLASGYEIKNNQINSTNLQNFTSFANNLNGSELTNISKKIDFFATYIVSGQYDSYQSLGTIIILSALIISIFFGFWIDSGADSIEPSFLLLTNESIKNREKTLIKLQRKWLSFIFSIIVSIGTGLGSNFLYNLLIK
jgi:hypothetical protein